jgi:hypothetical protein
MFVEWAEKCGGVCAREGRLPGVHARRFGAGDRVAQDAAFKRHRQEARGEGPHTKGEPTTRPERVERSVGQPEDDVDVGKLRGFPGLQPCR